MRADHLIAVVSLAAVASILAAAVNTAAQDPQAVEAELGLDRPTRRLIQQGLATVPVVAVAVFTAGIAAQPHEAGTAGAPPR